MSGLYSARELALFKALNAPQGMVDDEHSIPTHFYKYLTIEQFRKNTNGKAVESLRRCIDALLSCKPYRMTPDFDALIEL